MRMTGNNKGSGTLHEKALSDWFSTETMKYDFDMVNLLKVKSYEPSGSLLPELIPVSVA